MATSQAQSRPHCSHHRYCSYRPSQPCQLQRNRMLRRRRSRLCPLPTLHATSRSRMTQQVKYVQQAMGNIWLQMRGRKTAW